MSWIDFFWPMVTGACVTMGFIHLRIGLRHKAAAAHLLFALNAFVVAVYSCLEHALTRADSPARYLALPRWLDITAGLQVVTTQRSCGRSLAPAENGSRSWASAYRVWP